MCFGASRNEVAFPLAASNIALPQGWDDFGSCLSLSTDQALAVVYLWHSAEFFAMIDKRINPTLRFTEKCVQAPLISAKWQLCARAGSVKQQLFTSWSPSRLWAPEGSGVKVHTFLWAHRLWREWTLLMPPSQPAKQSLLTRNSPLGWASSPPSSPWWRFCSASSSCSADAHTKL